VVDGSRLPARVLRLLEEEAGLYRSESVIYFYSGAIFSFRGDGNVVTDQGVISYYPDPDTGELIVFKAAYEDIVDVQVTYPESFLEDTVVEILIGEEERFLLFASRERGRDRLFVDELVRRWKQQREATAPRGGVA
jgi:8-oxo-dGTP pyrophosphatase MutT (NUDIX family)